MPALTVNSLPVMQARLQLGRTGAWSAELSVDAAVASQLPSSSRQTLVVDTLKFSGTVLPGRSDAWAQTVSVKLVGGAHGLPSLAKPRFYQNVAAGQVVKDTLGDVGESLSSTADQNALGTQLPFWVSAQLPASSLLSLLADAVGGGCVWRVLPDGTVFFGRDTFPQSLIGAFDLVDYRPLDAYQSIASELPEVFPGETFSGRQVSAVEHVADGHGSRTHVWFER